MTTDQDMKKIYIDTLGCAKNEYDSQMLAASLVRRGCSIVSEPEEADVLIVNTCGFIEEGWQLPAVFLSVITLSSLRRCRRST